LLCQVVDNFMDNLAKMGITPPLTLSFLENRLDIFHYNIYYINMICIDCQKREGHTPNSKRCSACYVKYFYKKTLYGANHAYMAE